MLTRRVGDINYAEHGSGVGVGVIDIAVIKGTSVVECERRCGGRTGYRPLLSGHEERKKEVLPLKDRLTIGWISSLNAETTGGYTWQRNPLNLIVFVDIEAELQERNIRNRILDYASSLSRKSSGCIQFSIKYWLVKVIPVHRDCVCFHNRNTWKKIVNKQKLENNFMIAEGLTCEEKAKNNNNRQYALLLHHSPSSDAVANSRFRW